MNRWFLKRTAQVFVTVLGAIGISFALLRLMPGGPVSYLRAQMISQPGTSSISQVNDQIETYTNINPSDPLYVQFLDYLTAVLNGDFGQSIWYQKPVVDILAEALPWTIFLSIVSLAISFSLAIVLGATMAYFEGTRFDFTSSSLSILLSSIPFYVVAIALLAVLGYDLGWFPTGGRVSDAVEPGLNTAFIRSIVYHAVMPLAALIVAGFGGTALSMRGNSIRILGEDYLRVARLRGLPEKLIVLRYVGRNALLPLYTGLMMSIASIFGGSIILETIFTYPGMGWYMNRAFQTRDYPLLMGSFLLTTTMVILGIYVADLTYGKIDPRVERGDHRESY
ncbi:ABC transporter permease [Halomicrococcus sp. NG-SE-24]|uniref:ABC transporter permease n=1 Tax=Halomicrococcus sp. NG-SE-24 TaxID=3436928 RepID=UPI003D994C64